MDTDSEQGENQGIESFAGMVAYLWAINECIDEGAFGNLGFFAQELNNFIKRSAVDLGASELDAVLLGLGFFKEYANNLDMRVMPYTETIALAAAFV